MQRSEQSSSSRVQINTAKHGVLSTRISMINFGMLNGRPVANVTRAVECYGKKLAGWLIKTYLVTTTWLRLEYRHAPNHYGFRGATSG